MLNNFWGFHHILGNVGEWTSDRYLVTAYEDSFEPGTGARLVAKEDSTGRTIRGPGWFRDSSGIRVSARYMAHERIYKSRSFGLRSARMLED